MDTTTIKVHRDTKRELDHWREYPNESYDELLRKMSYLLRKVRKEPKLSQEALRMLELSRQQFKEGKYVTQDEMEARLARHTKSSTATRRRTSSTSSRKGYDIESFRQ